MQLNGERHERNEGFVEQLHERIGTVVEFVVHFGWIQGQGGEEVHLFQLPDFASPRLLREKRRRKQQHIGEARV